MKASMNAAGQVVIEPESHAEAHALNYWRNRSRYIPPERDMITMEKDFYKGTTLIVQTEFKG